MRCRTGSLALCLRPREGGGWGGPPAWRPPPSSPARPAAPRLLCQHAQQGMHSRHAQQGTHPATCAALKAQIRVLPVISAKMRESSAKMRESSAEMRESSAEMP